MCKNYRMQAQTLAECTDTAVKHYGKPERWLMHPVTVDTLARLDLIDREQLNNAVNSCSDAEARMQHRLMYFGRPIEIDWKQPFEVTMEVITLRSLWDQLP